MDELLFDAECVAMQKDDHCGGPENLQNQRYAPRENNYYESIEPSNLLTPTIAITIYNLSVLIRQHASQLNSSQPCISSSWTCIPYGRRGREHSRA